MKVPFLDNPAPDASCEPHKWWRSGRERGVVYLLVNAVEDPEEPLSSTIVKRADRGFPKLLSHLLENGVRLFCTEDADGIVEGQESAGLFTSSMLNSLRRERSLNARTTLPSIVGVDSLDLV